MRTIDKQGNRRNMASLSNKTVQGRKVGVEKFAGSWQVYELIDATKNVLAWFAREQEADAVARAELRRKDAATADDE